MATARLLKNLLQPPDRSVSVARATELLDANFTSFDHLLEPTGGDALKALLEKTRTSLEQLNTRLGSSSNHLRNYINETQEQTQSYLTKAQELALLRHALADELSSLSEDLLPSSSAKVPQTLSLLEELESQHAKLKELESVKSYLQVLQSAVLISENAVEAVKKIPPNTLIVGNSVANYKTLQTFVSTVTRHCEKAQDGNSQNLKLVSFLYELVEKTWLDMKDVLTNTLINAAEELKWPIPVNYTAVSPDARKAFETAFKNLLRLQDIAEESHFDSSASEDRERNVGLYPLQALVKPVALRFKYHFEGNRETNRLDKPEWYFAHILNVSYDHRPFLETVIQSLIQKSNYGSINAWREFTRLLLPIITRKMRRSAAALAPHPSLLAHTVYQSLAFDDALRDAGFTMRGTFGHSAKSPEDLEWEGTSEVILGSKELFEVWLDGERRFADDQYNEIISSPDAWHLSDEGDASLANDNEVQPTNAARRVKALVEQITDRYKLLPQFVHKTRFLTAVQVPVLEQFHTRISESLDAFETLSSFLVRAVPGSLTGQDSQGRDSKSMTSGVEGSRRLVKAYVSAKWMASVQTAWGEDVFFLELWHTICQKASLRKKAEQHDSLPNPNHEHDEGTIFDELVSQYLKLVDRAEGLLIRQICGEIESDLKAHLFRDNTAGVQTPESDTTISQTLLPPIARLSSHLKFLRETLPQITVANFYKLISNRLTTHILQRQVLYRGRSRMTSRDGRVVLEEANLWVEASRVALLGSVRRVDRPWARLLEAGRLLSLEGETFTQVVTSVRLGQDGTFKKIADDLGINELSQGEVLDVLSIREDFGR